MLAYIELYS